MVININHLLELKYLHAQSSQLFGHLHLKIMQNTDNTLANLRQNMSHIIVESYLWASKTKLYNHDCG